MKTTIEAKDNYSVIYLNGQFVGGDETDKLFDLVNAVLKTEHKNLILDFKNVVYFSSIVIGKLIKANRDFAEKSGKLILVNVNQTLVNVFSITKVTAYVTIADDIDSAVKNF